MTSPTNPAWRMSPTQSKIPPTLFQQTKSERRIPATKTAQEETNLGRSGKQSASGR